MTSNKIEATLALRSEGRFLVGRDRIKLLEAVAEHGSIAKAAKAIGYSYKTAWDSVNAINNLLPRPAFVKQAGGPGGGGGATITDEGRRLITTFHALEEKLSRISSAIAELGFEGRDDLFLFGLGVKVSTRNVFSAEIEQVERGPVDVGVSLRVSDQVALRSVVTNEAAENSICVLARGCSRSSNPRSLISTRRRLAAPRPETVSSARSPAESTDRRTAKSLS